MKHRAVVLFVREPSLGYNRAHVLINEREFYHPWLQERNKYTCIELKVDRATEQDLAQVLRYENWLARKLAAGDVEMIQSILVARRFADTVIDYVGARKRIEEKTVRLITYCVTDDGKRIDLQEELA